MTQGASRYPVPVLGVCAPSGTGKTTLITALIAHCRHAGLRVGALKQAREGFDVDYPGKDSHRLREAGAHLVLVGGGGFYARMRELRPGDAADLDAALAEFDMSTLDLILIEGFATVSIPRIALVRDGFTAPPQDWDHVALAVSDRPLDSPVPVYGWQDTAGLGDAVVAWARCHQSGETP